MIFSLLAPMVAICRMITTPGLAFWLRWSLIAIALGASTPRDPKRQPRQLWEVLADGSQLHPFSPGGSQAALNSAAVAGPRTARILFFSPRIAATARFGLCVSGGVLPRARPSQITVARWTTCSVNRAGQRAHSHGNTAQFELLRAVPNSSAFMAFDQNLSAASWRSTPDWRWIAWINAADNSLVAQPRGWQ